MPGTSSEYEWATLTREYEGFPLYLRFPLRLDYDVLQNRFPVRIVLTHTFNFRQFDGSPEPSYNEMLEEFDLSLVTYFKTSALGQIVLVETYGGKRHYYYVAASVDAATMLPELRSRFARQRIDLQSKSDPAWQFISSTAEPT